jgi:glycosyltransferase involved in cell wall biosynthesis
MKTSCLITSFNYARFLPEAIESALQQTAPLDEIIVVDDGSTDGTLDLLEQRYAGHPRVRWFTKANGGQLSCFNAGFQAAQGEWIFFLDADDALEPHCAAECRRAWVERPGHDCIFWANRLFGDRHEDRHEYPHDFELGYSVLRTWYLQQWIGAPTSCLCIHRRVLSRVLPLPLETDWRIRADDCLVYGTSLVGAKKFYLDRVLTRYRVHGDNHHFDKPLERNTDERRRLAIERLFAHLAQQLGYDEAQFPALLSREFASIPRPTLKLLRQYLRINRRLNIPWSRRLSQGAALTRHYLSSLTGGESSENRAAA